MEAIHEIEIRGYLEWDLPPGARVLGQAADVATVSGRQVAEAIETARLAGVRAIVLVLEGPGGSSEAAFKIGDELRAFSAAGGLVVIYLPGEVASAYVPLALVGDVVLLGPDAPGFWVHGPVSRFGYYTAAACVAWNASGRRGRPTDAFLEESRRDFTARYGGPRPDEAELLESVRERMLAVLQARTARPGVTRSQRAMRTSCG